MLPKIVNLIPFYNISIIKQKTILISNEGRIEHYITRKVNTLLQKISKF